ncbi:hypothetical protein MHU86_11273 [Fragilaria crotonensis]|nr:hypothetical protein MHU86_11273 [Fragilaria crotonensis]
MWYAETRNQNTRRCPTIHEIYCENGLWHIRGKLSWDDILSFSEPVKERSLPCCLAFLVVILLQTLDRLIPDRVNFVDFGDMVHTRLSDAFVDDTSLSFTSSSDTNNIDDLIARLEKIAQTWEHLLHLSGGKLNLAKCSWFIVRWEWTKGRPVIRPIAATDREVKIYHGTEKHNPSIITRTKPDESTRMLGVFMNPLATLVFT